MWVVHRNTPDGVNGRSTTSTPASAVFESPGSPGGRSGDKHAVADPTQRQLDDELRLVPVEEDTEADELAREQEDVLQEHAAASNAARRAMEAP